MLIKITRGEFMHCVFPVLLEFDFHDFHGLSSVFRCCCIPDAKKDTDTYKGAKGDIRRLDSFKTRYVSPTIDLDFVLDQFQNGNLEYRAFVVGKDCVDVPLFSNQDLLNYLPSIQGD